MKVREKIMLCIALLSILLMIAFISLSVYNVNKAKDLSQLDTPVNLKISENVLNWDKVENAVSYDIMIDSEMHNSVTNTFLLSITLDKIYIIRVKALGDMKTYKDSDWSGQINYNPAEINSSIDIGYSLSCNDFL